MKFSRIPHARTKSRLNLTNCSNRLDRMPTNFPISVVFQPPSIGRISKDFVEGFLHLWALYVRGFDPRYHCQRCLQGPLSKRVITAGTLIGEEILLDEFDDYRAIYLCGVARGKITNRKLHNLHLPIERSVGEVFEYTTYNRYHLIVKNGRLLPIPELPENWMGLPASYWRCCNFRFGASLFNCPERATPSDALSRSRM